jgi:hypothetical protein
MDGFEARRETGPPEPVFQPPVDPGDGPSLRGLALVARIMRARELADAAGIPPLDSDQVLDLQRSAGNRMTAAALARWIDALPGENAAQELLARLFTDPALHDAVCAALDALDPVTAVDLTGPAGHVALEVLGPRGGAAFEVTPPATVELSFNAVFGPAAAIGPHDHLKLTIADRQTLELPIPFAQAATGGGYAALATLR